MRVGAASAGVIHASTGVLIICVLACDFAHPSQRISFQSPAMSCRRAFSLLLHLQREVVHCSAAARHTLERREQAERRDKAPPYLEPHHLCAHRFSG